MKFINLFSVKVALCALILYKYCISPFLPGACMYQVTCSEYAMRSIKSHGIIIGLWRAFKRLCTCHPFHTNNNKDFQSLS